MSRYRSEFEAYPFLNEASSKCDYEIMTDRYASEIGELYGLMPETYRTELRFLCETVYHLNPAARQPNAVTSEERDKLIAIMKKHEAVVPKNFVLPLSENKVAGRCHVLRSEAKSIIRLMYRLEREENVYFDQIVWDSFHILSQIFFEYALELSPDSVPFQSRVY